MKATRREATQRAKQRQAHLEGSKNRSRYYYHSEEYNTKWKPSGEDKKKEEEEEVLAACSWDSIDLHTGEVQSGMEETSSDGESVEESSQETEEAKPVQNYQLDDFYGLSDLSSALTRTNIPFNIQDSHKSALKTTRKQKTLLIELSPSVPIEFEVEDISVKPRAVMFSIRFPTDIAGQPTKKDRKKYKTHISPPKILVGDNCSRQCFIFYDKKEVSLIHCGTRTFSMSTMLQKLSNFPVSVLGVHPSRIINLQAKYSATLDVTCPEVGPLQTYTVPQVLQDGVSPHISLTVCGIRLTRKHDRVVAIIELVVESKRFSLSNRPL